MISREEALQVLKKYLKEPNNIKFSLTLEAVLIELAKILHKDEELWGLTGLLHNLDYEYSKNELEKRGNLSAQLLDGLLPEKSVNAIRAINYVYTDYIPITSLDKILLASEAMTRLILETAESLESKDIKDVELETLIAKYNDPSFADDINRSRIELCVDVGLEMETFFKINLKTIKDIAPEINL